MKHPGSDVYISIFCMVFTAVRDVSDAMYNVLLKTDKKPPPKSDTQLKNSPGGFWPTSSRASKTCIDFSA